MLLLLTGMSSQAQCIAGYTAARLDWENIDFLPSNNTLYTNFYNATTFPYTQKFGIGTRTVTFSMSNDLTLAGENNDQTADAGADVEFSGNTGTITMTFDQEVMNVRFSIYDIDRRQNVTINSRNAANNNVTTLLARRSTAILTLAGNPGNNPSATSCTTAGTCEVADNSNDGTIDVTVAGPVRTITITLGNNGNTPPSPEIFLSDITACVTGSFPTNYYNISRPFTGQSQYVLTVLDNNIYFTDPATGFSRFLFNDPGHPNINSMGYDPYNRWVYYTYSLTSDDRNELKIKKCDLNTGTITVLVSDVRTIGISTYEEGVISGAAAFYNGSFYIGIEGYTGTSGGGAYAAGRKSCVWKIDFNASGAIVGNAAQVYGSLADNGTNASNIHDWSDFGISNGIIYDFDGSVSGNNIYHYDMMTGTVTNTYSPGATFTPGQVSVGWDGTVYQQYANGASSLPHIARYNLDGTIGTRYNLSSNPMFTPASPSLGDAAEAYRPFLDFGDAPATYDPAANDPAVHDSSRATLRLGADINVEWLKRGTTSTNDPFDDGLPSVPILSPGNPFYATRMSVFNNTGAPATLIGWLDYNNNGVFDPAEGRSVTVNSSPSLQNVWVIWNGFTISPTLVQGTYTYVRYRLTSASNGMTVNNPTGFYSNGEVEDYRVIVDNYPLAVSLLDFDAKVTPQSKVKLNWKTATEDENMAGYGVERSRNGSDWEAIGFVAATHKADGNVYDVMDNAPYMGTSRYRLRIGQNSSGAAKYSDIRTVTINDKNASVLLAPNPASDKAILTITNAQRNKTVDIRVLNTLGVVLLAQKQGLAIGANPIELPLPASWPSGTYMVQVISEEGVINKKLLIRR